MFAANEGEVYYDGIFDSQQDSLIAVSCVKDSKSGDIILKVVNASKQAQLVNINLSVFKKLNSDATCTVLSGKADDKNTFDQPSTVLPKNEAIKIQKKMNYNSPALSLSVIRMKNK